MRKKCGVIVKVEYEKAYHLYYNMGKLDFCSKWVKWIKSCLELSTIFILMNKSPTKEYKPRRELRQADLVTHFLFLIVVEGLTCLVR